MGLNKVSQQLAALQANLTSDASPSDLDLIVEGASELILKTKDAAQKVLLAPRTSTKQLAGRVVPLDTQDGVAEMAQSIFNQAVEMKSAKIEKDVALIAQLGALDTKVLQLSMTRFEKDPETVADEIAILAREADGISAQSPTTEQARGKLDQVKRQIESLMFRFVFPIVDELDDCPGTFAHTLRQIHVGG